MKKICVIGGLGFIGSRFYKTYSNNYNVSIIDKAESLDIKSFMGDVRDEDSLSKFIGSDNEVIINLAAEHKDNVTPISLYQDVNVGGAKNICSVASKKGINKIIFTSTVAVYGFASPNTGENGQIKPFNSYGKTKYAAEEVFKNWQREDPVNRSLVIIRPTVVFGENNRGNVYSLFKQIASGTFIMVGDGKNKKSIAYVDNLVAFLHHSVNFGVGIHIHNFVDKPDFNMNSLVETCKKHLGVKNSKKINLPYCVGSLIGRVFDVTSFLIQKKFSISYIRIKKFCSNSTYSTSVGSTGFSSPVALDEALKRTLEFEFDKNQ